MIFFLNPPPSKLVNFTESRLEHIQFVHNFFCCDIFHTIKFWYLRISINNQQIIGKVVSLVRLLGAVDGIISIKIHLKGAFGLSRILDLAFLFIEEIWHKVQKGSGSILSSTSSQTLTLYSANNDLVDLWPNLWCRNSKAIFFLAGIFFSLTYPWFFL